MTLKVKRTVRVEPLPASVIDTAIRLLTTEGLTPTATELRYIHSALDGIHPYITFCNQANFTDDELLERSTESLRAIATVVKSAFTTVKTAVVAVAGSSKHLPVKLTQALGLGTTWGGVAAWLTYMFVGEAAISTFIGRTNVKLDGIADLDALTEKRQAMGESASMKVVNKHWVSPNPLTPEKIVAIINAQVKLAESLIKMSDRLPDVLGGKLPINEWLSILSQPGSVSHATPVLHGNVGFMVYNNDGKYFLERVHTGKSTATLATVGSSGDMRTVQNNAAKLGKVIPKLSNTVEKALNSAMSMRSGAVDESSFAFNTLEVITSAVITSSTLLIGDCKDYVADSIVAIIKFKPDAEAQ